MDLWPAAYDSHDVAVVLFFALVAAILCTALYCTACLGSDARADQARRRRMPPMMPPREPKRRVIPAPGKKFRRRQPETKRKPRQEEPRSRPPPQQLSYGASSKSKSGVRAPLQPHATLHRRIEAALRSEEQRGLNCCDNPNVLSSSLFRAAVERRMDGIG